MRRLSLLVVSVLVPMAAAAQERPSHEVFAGYQQVPGEERTLRGGGAGIVFHTVRAISGIVTVSAFRDPRDETIVFTDGMMRREGGQTAVHVGGGGRWHGPRRRVQLFAQAMALLAYTRTVTTVTTDSPGAAVEHHRRSTVDPMVQAGVGVTIKATRRFGISGSFDLYRPLFNLQVETTHYRGFLGATVTFGSR